MLLQLSNISKWIHSGGNRVFLLKNINLNVEEGEFISVMGPSGSGKSTLLNVIGMLDDFNLGEYNFMNESVHTLKEKYRANLYKQYIGFVFQQYHLIDELTVYENIETVSKYKIERTKSHGCRYARPVQHRRKKRFVSYPTFRRTATIGRHRQGTHRKTQIDIGR